jgi:hypothetical protein
MTHRERVCAFLYSTLSYTRVGSPTGTFAGQPYSPRLSSHLDLNLAFLSSVNTVGVVTSNLPAPISRTTYIGLSYTFCPTRPGYWSERSRYTLAFIYQHQHRTTFSSFFVERLRRSCRKERNCRPLDLGQKAIGMMYISGSTAVRSSSLADS